ncbi:hypothetical protein LXL04_037325 [Taraxacum kok-saghyz]
MLLCCDSYQLVPLPGNDSTMVTPESQIVTQLEARMDAQDEKLETLSIQIKDLTASVNSMKEVLNDLPKSMEKMLVSFQQPAYKHREPVIEADRSLKQEGDVGEYIENFKALSAFIHDESEEQLLGMFIHGLHINIRNWVKFLSPTTCEKAMDLARNVAIATGATGECRVKTYQYMGSSGPNVYGMSSPRSPTHSTVKSNSQPQQLIRSNTPSGQPQLNSHNTSKLDTRLTKESRLFWELMSQSVKRQPYSIEINKFVKEAKSTSIITTEGKKKLISLLDIDDYGIRNSNPSISQSEYDLKFYSMEVGLSGPSKGLLSLSLHLGGSKNETMYNSWRLRPPKPPDHNIALVLCSTTEWNSTHNVFLCFFVVQPNRLTTRPSLFMKKTTIHGLINSPGLKKFQNVNTIDPTLTSYLCLRGKRHFVPEIIGRSSTEIDAEITSRRLKLLHYRANVLDKEMCKKSVDLGRKDDTRTMKNVEPRSDSICIATCMVYNVRFHLTLYITHHHQFHRQNFYNRGREDRSLFTVKFRETKPKPMYKHARYTVNGGRERRPLGAYKFIEELGAGEILLHCINYESQAKGFDIDLLKLISVVVSIPANATPSSWTVF